MPTQWKSAASTTTISASSCSSPKSRTRPGSTPCFVSWRRSLSAMFVTIWTWTQEWSLIAIRETALTFATCHQPLSWLSALTRSITVRSLRLPRTGTLIRMRATASAGVRRVSCSASASTGCSIRSAVSLSMAMNAVCRMCDEYRHERSSDPARRRGRPPPEPPHRLLPPAPRDPTHRLVFPLVDRRADRRDPQLVRHARDGAAATGVPSLPLPVRPLLGAPGRLPLPPRQPLSGLHGRGWPVSGRRRPAGGTPASVAMEDAAAADPGDPGFRHRFGTRRRVRHPDRWLRLPWRRPPLERLQRGLRRRRAPRRDLRPPRLVRVARHRADAERAP